MFLELLPVLYSIGYVVYGDYQGYQSIAQPTPIVQQEQINYDFFSDASLQRFVGPNDPLNNPGYLPSNLVALKSSNYLQLSSPMKLRADVADIVYTMSKALYAETGYPLVIVSAYRSYAHQLRINNVYGADTLRAKAGHSEHQLGLAIDILGLTNAGIESNPQYRTIYYRMVSNAHRYGFTQSYQKGPAVDGYERENRHRRYVGPAIASLLSEQAITFTEYVESQKFRP